MTTRRRFLAITAAALAMPRAGYAAEEWRGTALGADARIVLHGDRDTARAALDRAVDLLRGIESQFSLHDPASALSRLNATGSLAAPSPDMASLFAAAGHAHRLTDGRFDPTVQPLWRALADGGDVDTARLLVGWSRIRADRQTVRLAPGQSLTFNGIAQGYATDRVANLLAAHGFGRALIDIGEFRGIGGPWLLAIQDPSFGALGRLSLTDGAIASSSPGALRLPGGTHILDPLRGAVAPSWSTVSVEAATATLADALSTAFCLMPRDGIARTIALTRQVRRVVLIDRHGTLTTLRP